MDGVDLKTTNVKAFAYTVAKPVKFIGKFETLVETRKRVAVATFYVASNPNSGNLISSTTAQDLGLISLHVNKVSATSNDPNMDKIHQEKCKTLQRPRQAKRRENQTTHQ